MLKLFGIPIRFDLSWLFIFTLVVWSLATGFFPLLMKDTPVSASTLWLISSLGGVGLFLSILLHELTHALVARKYGLKIKQIKLFIFGGVAEMPDEPSSPQLEFKMAIAGPLLSLFLGGLFFSIENLWQNNGIHKEVAVLIRYLGWANVVLAAFNLLPAFPLDGGRILRSILWYRTKSLVEATRIASNMGSGFGVLLMALGVVTLLWGNFVGGVWYFLIGMFLRDAARVSYRQVIIKKSLEGETVGKFMNRNPVVVSPQITLDQFADDFLIRYPYRLFPVVNKSHVLGTMSIDELKGISKNKWSEHTVNEFLKPLSPRNSVAADTDAKTAFALMNSEGISRLLVLDNGKLVGIVSLKDLLRFITAIYEIDTSISEAA